MKTCKTCLIQKAFDDFNKHPTTSDRLQQSCRSCNSVLNKTSYLKNKEKIKIRNAAYQRNNREKKAAANRRWREANKELLNAQARQRYALNPARQLAATRKWELNNPEKRRAISRRYADANPSRLTSYTSRKRAEKLAMPSWANQFMIHEAYHLAAIRTKMLGIKFTVDHIVPLYGKTVCGLHVENNLAVISHAENARKGNRHWPDMPMKETINGL